MPVTLPAFYCPLPSAVHPDADAMDVVSVAWMERFGLYADEAQRARLARGGCGGKLAGHLFPYGDRDRVQLIGDFCMWNFAFDDEYCDEGPLGRKPAEFAEVLARIHRVLESPEAAPHAPDRYADSLRELRIRLDAVASPVQTARFVEAMRAWFMTELWKSGNLARGHIPDPADYLVMRLLGGGSIVYPTLVPIAAGIVVPEAELEDRRIRALTEMAALLGTLHSDVMSFRRERHRAQDHHNIVDVLRHAHSLGEDEAVDEALALCRRIMSLFLRLRDQVTATSSPQLAQYLDGLGTYVRGAIDWSLRTDRNSHPSSPDTAPVIRPGGWLDDPGEDPGAAGPPAIATIAWWWQYDPARTAPP